MPRGKSAEEQRNVLLAKAQSDLKKAQERAQRAQGRVEAAEAKVTKANGVKDEATQAVRDAQAEVSALTAHVAWVEQMPTGPAPAVPDAEFGNAEDNEDVAIPELATSGRHR